MANLTKIVKSADFVYEGRVRGFPVQVHLWMHPAEPDVGIMRRGINDYLITTMKGWDAAFLKLTEDELEDVLVDAEEAERRYRWG